MPNEVPCKVRRGRFWRESSAPLAGGRAVSVEARYCIKEEQHLAAQAGKRSNDTTTAQSGVPELGGSR